MQVDDTAFSHVTNLINRHGGFPTKVTSKDVAKRYLGDHVLATTIGHFRAHELAALGGIDAVRVLEVVATIRIESGAGEAAIRALGEFDDPVDRQAALAALRWILSTSNIDQLVSGPMIECRVLSSMANLGDSNARRELRRRARGEVRWDRMKDERHWAQRVAIDGLGRIGGVDELGDLIHVLRRSDHEAMTVTVALAMYSIGRRLGIDVPYQLGRQDLLEWCEEKLLRNGVVPPVDAGPLGK